MTAKMIILTHSNLEELCNLSQYTVLECTKSQTSKYMQQHGVKQRVLKSINGLDILVSYLKIPEFQLVQMYSIGSNAL